MNKSTEPDEGLQDRLNYALRMSGKNPAQVARYFDLNKSGVARWFTKKVPEKHLPKLAKFLKVEFEWLATGENFQAVEEKMAEYTNGSDKDREVLTLDISLSAGGGSSAPEFIEKRENHTYKESFLRRNGLKAKDLRIVYVRGDSMMPTIDDGDKVLVDTSRTRIIDQKIYAIATGGDLKIKRLRKLYDGSVEIISDSNMFENETVVTDDLDYLHIIGQVIEISRLMI